MQVSVGNKLKLNAIFDTDIRRQAYIIQPNKKVIQIEIQPNQSNSGAPPNLYFRSGTPIKVEFPFTMTGTHVIEINEVSGSAIVNQPVYVGTCLPLLPDH